MPDINKHLFTIYHPYDTDEQVSNSTKTSVYAANCFYFGYNLDNLSIASFFACDGRACTTKPDLVTKKKKLSKAALELFDLFQSLFFLFYLTIFKYVLISKWQFRTTLASFPMLGDYLSVKLTSEALLSLFHSIKIVKSLPNNNALIYN